MLLAPGEARTSADKCKLMLSEKEQDTGPQGELREPQNPNPLKTFYCELALKALKGR